MGLSNNTSGEIMINNQPDLYKARNSIGFMIGLPFFPYLTAYQNIEYYRKLKGIKDKKETERVLKLVKQSNSFSLKNFSISSLFIGIFFYSEI